MTEFPMISLKPAMTDAELQFQSDIAYMQDLLLDISRLAYTSGHANPFPITMSDELDAAITAVKSIR